MLFYLNIPLWLYKLRISSTILTTESQTELNWLKRVGKTANTGFVAEADQNVREHRHLKVNSNFLNFLILLSI